MVRAWSGMQPWLVLAVLGVPAGLLSASATARACTCLERFGVMLWPIAGRRDVPLDTPIVVERGDLSGDTEGIAIRLVDEQGNPVELRERRRFDQLEPSSCWSSETVFLKPAALLAAGATYTVFVGDDGRSFTTGSQLTGPVEYETPRIRYLHTSSRSSCSDEEQACQLAELHVTFEAPLPSALWLRVRSAASHDNENRWVFRAPAWRGATADPQIPVVLPDGEKCVELGLYDAYGEPVLERELCTPDACAVYELRRFSSCGEPPSSGLDSTRVSSDSCDDPILIEDGADGPIYPDDSGAAVDAGRPAERDSAVDDTGADAEPEPKTVTACACSVPGRGGGSGSPLTWLFVVLGLAWLGRASLKIP